MIDPLSPMGPCPILEQKLNLAAEKLRYGSFIHASLALIIAICFYRWGLPSSAHLPLIIWTITLISCAMMRAAACFWYIKARPGIKIGRRLHIATGLLVGLSWGALPILFFDVASLEQLVLISFAIGGISMGSLVISGYYIPSFYAVFLPAMTPLIGLYLLSGQPMLGTMGLMLGIFWAVIAFLGAAFSRTIDQMLHAKANQTDLLERLQKNSDILKAALNAGYDDFIMFDPDDRLIIWNQSFASRAEPVIGPLETGLSFHSIIKRAARRHATHDPYGNENSWYAERMKRHEQLGKPFEIALAGMWLLVLEVRTHTGHLVVTHTDITDLKMREAQLRDQEAARSGIMHAALDGIITIDEGGRVIDYNHAASTIFGWEPLEIIGRPVFEKLVPPKARAAFAQELASITDHTPSRYIGQRIELTAQRRDGSPFPAELSLVSVKTARGALLTGFIRDISDRLESEDRLRTARDEAEAANRAKSDFLAAISHEIRTPMNGVLGALDLLLDTRLIKDRETLTPAQTRLASIARDASESLRGLLDDLLDYSRLEQGQLDLKPADFCPIAIARSCCDAYALQCETQGVPITLSIDERVPTVLRGDSARLRQILMNLLSNALKFTTHGHIDMHLEKRAGSADFHVIRFGVKDSGIGIPDAFRAHIFSRFSQMDPANARLHGGSGLGLAIVRDLAALMGGLVDYESTPGKGSYFWCDLPFLAPDPAPQSDETSPKATPEPSVRTPDIAGPDLLAGARLLVVDDSEANRLVASETLRRAGAVVMEAESGPDAIEIIKTTAIDLIIMDISMPQMDGIETMQRIRQMDGPKKPIIALTAQASVEARAHFETLGFDGFLSKPFRREIFLQMVHRLLGDHQHFLSEQPIDDADFATEDLSNITALNLETLEILAADIGPARVEPLIATFIDEAANRRSTIKQARKSDDPARISLQAHALKSAAANFGALALSAAAARLEAQAAHQDRAALDEAIQALDTALDQGVRLLHAYAQRPHN
ncbi:MULTISPECIES: response regulator [unclassified Iodidimonas]|jgi:PAS domain S-box-containing protein|uniref:hybrid sensor histidine kinase/response regulator n=1 Tax=unclassified Iodidimonas TaxID=2626145 RepID=UPI00248291FB|nr:MULTISPECIES: response regulator [unclassified Iodidimonas]